MPRLRESLKWMLTKMAFFCEFSMLTRSSSGMNTSDDRVMTVFNCDSRSLRSRRWATSSATIFSGGPERRAVPLSLPPWPASTTTVVKVLLVFLTLPVGRARAERNQQTEGKSKTDRSRHPDLIAKNSFFTKSFSLVTRAFGL